MIQARSNLPEPIPIEGSPAHHALMQMIHGAMSTELIGLTARLGIPDVLRDGPRTSAEVAHVLGVHPGALHRLMRGLVMCDLLHEHPAGRFGLSPAGALLRSDVPGSMHDAACWMHDVAYPAIHGLLHTIETGEIAFDHVFGEGLFDHLVKHRETADRFDRLMTVSTEGTARSAMALHDFSPFRHLFDVGGGNGAFLVEILRANPHMRGTLVEAPSVAERARHRLERAGLGGRGEVQPCDFFDAVPPGGDIYLLSRVLHDWDDDACGVILRNCHRAMGGKGKLLVVEQLLAERVANNPAAIAADLEMLVMLPGRERSLQEIREILSKADFTVTGVTPLLSPGRDTRYMIEAEPVAPKT